jgi:hypothetical protein
MKLTLPLCAALAACCTKSPAAEPLKWINNPAGAFTVAVAEDGSGLRWTEGGRTVAAVAPLFRLEGVVPRLQLERHGSTFRFRGEGLTLVVTITGEEVGLAIESGQACEGPVFRIPSALEQGVFAGLEYLGQGEVSSSKLDIETSEHQRFAPDRRKVTMPLMACKADGITAAMTWSDMRLQPTFSVPDGVDELPGHRMSLRGKKIDAVLRVHRGALEDAILWAVQKQDLPPLPRPPRTWEQQRTLCLQALNGPLKGKEGWGHCAEANWARQPYADCASTVFRLAGQAPELPRLVPGGAHLVNDAIYWSPVGRPSGCESGNSRRPICSGNSRRMARFITLANTAKDISRTRPVAIVPSEPPDSWSSPGRPVTRKRWRRASGRWTT